MRTKRKIFHSLKSKLIFSDMITSYLSNAIHSVVFATNDYGISRIRKENFYGQNRRKTSFEVRKVI